MYTHLTSKVPGVIKVGSRTEAIAKYRARILMLPRLLERLPELVGKRLGCFCKPHEQCHGDVLIELIKERGLE